MQTIRKKDTYRLEAIASRNNEPMAKLQKSPRVKHVLYSRAVAVLPPWFDAALSGPQISDSDGSLREHGERAVSQALHEEETGHRLDHHIDFADCMIFSNICSCVKMV